MKKNKYNLNLLHDLVSGIAHEINNPLAILHGKSMILLNKLKKEENKKIVEDIVHTIEKVDDIINNLRYFMTDDSLNPYGKISVNNLLKNVKLISLDRFRKANIKIEIINTLDLEIECKPIQVAQVLANLINNSYDAIVHQQSPWIKIETSESNGVVIFSVTDSGNGISSEISKKILTNFQTSKELTKNSGMGIGLKISKRIAENHNGKLIIDASSSNTKFDFHLPLKRAS